ncbi:MAG TPA: hypothetical protein VI216_02200 [Candidatus Acidoferrales bacterium]
MDDIWPRFFGDLVDRISGPMKFRLVLQPLMAAFFAIRSGLNDAKAGKPPFFWSLISDPAHDADRIKDGWKSVGRVFVLALVLDVVYQIIAEHFVYSGEGDHRRGRAGACALPDSARAGHSYGAIIYQTKG